MARRRSTINRKEYMDTIDANQPRHRMDRTANASSLLKANEDVLKSISDVDQLISTVLDIVEPTVGHGMSESNWKMFQRDLMTAAQDGLMSAKRYLYNYALKGYGHGVISTQRESQKEIANTILEHADRLFKSKPQVAELLLYKAIKSKLGTSIDESVFEDFAAKMPENPKHYHRYLAETVAKINNLKLVESEQGSIARLLTESSGTRCDMIIKKMAKLGFQLG